MAYGIWCEVWGGVTGHRSSWMTENKIMKTFATIEEAQMVAENFQRLNNNPNRTANFSYTAKEI